MGTVVGKGTMATPLQLVYLSIVSTVNVLSCNLIHIIYVHCVLGEVHTFGVIPILPESSPPASVYFSLYAAHSHLNHKHNWYQSDVFRVRRLRTALSLSSAMVECSQI